MSIHIARSQAKAAAMGAFAGDDRVSDLWALPKRELVELVLRFGALCSPAGACDDVMEGYKLAFEEIDVLRRAGIV